MRMTDRNGLIILMLLWTTVQSFGQIDTLTHSAVETEFQVKAKFRDRTFAWTADATGGLMYEVSYIFRYGVGTQFEYKLKDCHSLGAGLSLIISDWKPLFSNYTMRNASLELNLGYRYYHNLRKRISKGQTGNNFFANYFIISPYFRLQYKPYTLENHQWDFDQGTWALEYSSAVELNPGLRLGYGLQRNFKENMKFDIQVGLQSWRGTHVDSPAEVLYFQFSIGYILK